MPIDVETDYEKRVKGWRKIYILFILFMLLIFFGIISNVFGIMKENTPFIMKKCEWNVKKIISSGNSFSSKNLAIEEAKKYVNVSYTNISVSGEFDKCIGWMVEFMNDSIPVKKVLVCEKGWIYVYERKCQQRNLLSSVIEFLKSLTGWIK